MPHSNFKTLFEASKGLKNGDYKKFSGLSRDDLLAVDDNGTSLLMNAIYHQGINIQSGRQERAGISGLELEMEEPDSELAGQIGLAKINLSMFKANLKIAESILELIIAIDKSTKGNNPKLLEKFDKLGRTAMAAMSNNIAGMKLLKSANANI